MSNLSESLGQKTPSGLLQEWIGYRAPEIEYNGRVLDWWSNQVQFGEERVRIRFFVMTFGDSRRMFVRAFPNERLGALIEAHEEAFHFFGRVTEAVLYDNPKTMVIKREGATVVLNGVFEGFVELEGDSVFGALVLWSGCGEGLPGRV